MSDHVVMDRQGLDKIGEVATGLLAEHAWALSIKICELIFTRKEFSTLYKVTFAFKSRQRVDRFIGGTSWFWLKYTIALVYRRPREIASLYKEGLSSGQNSWRNGRMKHRSDRWWRKK